MSLKEPNSKLIRWRLKLEEFDYEIIYKKGKLNTNADALSRIRIDTPKLIDVNLNDTASIQGTSGSTIHSAEENLNDGIHISEKPLNEFNLQLVFEKSSNTPEMLVIMPFKNKQRRIFRKPLYTEEIITDIIKKFLNPNKLSAIFADEDTFRIIQSVY